MPKALPDGPCRRSARESDVALLLQNAANELRAAKTEAEAFVMWALDKKPLGGETDSDAASPVLIVVALLLFFIFMVATVSLHHETFVVAMSSHGIGPGFTGP